MTVIFSDKLSGKKNVINNVKQIVLEEGKGFEDNVYHWYYRIIVNGSVLGQIYRTDSYTLEFVTA